MERQPLDLTPTAIEKFFVYGSSRDNGHVAVFPYFSNLSATLEYKSFQIKIERSRPTPEEKRQLADRVLQQAQSAAWFVVNNLPHLVPAFELENWRHRQKLE